jgi:Ca2+-binding EF-hand superfamily protein
VNGDGRVNSGDLQRVAAAGIGPAPGSRFDQDADNFLTANDLNKVAIQFNKTVQQCP